MGCKPPGEFSRFQSIKDTSVNSTLPILCAPGGTGELYVGKGRFSHKEESVNTELDMVDLWMN